MTTMPRTRSAVLLLLLALSRTSAFVVQTRVNGSSASLSRTFSRPIESESATDITSPPSRNTFAAASLAVALTFSSAVALPCLAVSGGGLDFAGSDISGQDFSNGNYKGKDFTQVLAKATNFAGSNLQGCRFYKAYLQKVNFEGADLSGAAFDDTSMDEANLKNVVATGAFFSQGIIDAADLENGDFTDALFPTKTLPLLCAREDVKGTNPTTGADTRESLMCP